MRKRGLDKRGQTDVIVTVLLVLIALAAVAFIATFIINQVKQGVKEAEIKSKNYNLYIEKVQLIDGLKYGLEIVRADDGEPIKGLNIVVEDSSKKPKSYKDYTSFEALEKKIIYIPAEIRNIAKISLYPIINSSDKEHIGNLASTTEVNYGSSSSSGSKAVEFVSNNLVAYYPFEGNANDAGGKSNHGQIFGANCNAAGKVGKACLFDGLDDYVRTPIYTIGPKGTISMWVNPLSYKQFMGVFSKSIGGSNNNLFLDLAGYSGSGSIVNLWKLETGNSTYYSEVSLPSNSIRLNSWQQITATWNDTTICIYSNATSIVSPPSCSNSRIYPFYDHPSVSVILGGGFGSTTSYNFNGTIDEVRLYNKVLSAEEILRLYNFDKS